MKEIIVEEYILKKCQNVLRIAANILESRARLISADRQIEFSERLIDWILSDRQGERPMPIPKR